jgi:HK97 family phage prohead protease
MNKQFNFYIPLQKDVSSNDMLIGVASTLSLDRDNEKMSEKALEEMENDIKTLGINLFGNHEHNWENTLGVIKEAQLNSDKLMVGIQLDDATTNPKVPMLLNKLARGIKLGLSVGGTVTKEKYEYDKEANKRVKVIDGVKLYEISVVGIPSNVESVLSIPNAINKCFKSINLNIKKCPVCYSQMEKKCQICLYS